MRRCYYRHDHERPHRPRSEHTHAPAYALAFLEDPNLGPTVGFKQHLLFALFCLLAGTSSQSENNGDRFCRGEASLTVS